MRFVKRIFLFLTVNFLVITTLSLVLHLFHVQPYLTAYGLNVRELLIFCLIWGMGGAFISLLLSKPLAKWMMGVKIIPQTTNAPHLQNLLSTVQTLSKQAGLRKAPDVGIFVSKDANAFATGMSRNRSLVALSTALLERMAPHEVEAVIAHEITHIANGDMVTMALLQGVVNVFVLFLSRICAYLLASVLKSDRNSKISYGTFYLSTFLFQFVFMLLGSVVVAWFSRKREYRADKGAAMLTSPNNMKAALTRLGQLTKRKNALETMMINGRKQKGFLRYLSSHPSLSERKAALSSLKEQIDSAAAIT